MKKALLCIAAVLIVLMLVLYFVPMGDSVPTDVLLNIGGVLLLVVVVWYAAQFGGIRCPNCGCRIEAKYGQRTAIDGRFPCPKCGAMIER